MFSRVSFVELLCAAFQVSTNSMTHEFVVSKIYSLVQNLCLVNACFVAFCSLIVEFDVLLF